MNRYQRRQKASQSRSAEAARQQARIARRDARDQEASAVHLAKENADLNTQLGESQIAYIELGLKLRAARIARWIMLGTGFITGLITGGLIRG